MRKFLIPIVVVLLVVGIASFFMLQKPDPATTPSSMTPTAASESPTTPPVQLSETAKTIFDQLPPSLPKASWEAPIASNTTTSYGNATGYLENGTITAETASLPHFENKATLSSLGFVVDNNLSADGPGSSLWGYKKTTGNEIQLIIFSYKTDPTSSNPNEPLQFNCPCQTQVSVFVTNPFTPTTSN